jgi:5-methylcytosine-specific restriction endonuclease McrA
MERVLLLNGNYAPLAQVTVPKAVNLLIGDKVDPVEGVARELQTPSTVFTVPSVIVLKRFINVPARNKKWSRRGVFERDSYTCIYCGSSAGSRRSTNRKWRFNDFTIDHIRPVSQGGKSTWSNTACACYPCNHLKRDRMPNIAGMKMRWEPKIPRTNYWVASGEYPVEWRKYFGYD